jgi:hypothetical protein
MILPLEDLSTLKTGVVLISDLNILFLTHPTQKVYVLLSEWMQGFNGKDFKTQE